MKKKILINLIIAFIVSIIICNVCYADLQINSNEVTIDDKNTQGNSVEYPSDISGLENAIYEYYNNKKQNVANVYSINDLINLLELKYYQKWSSLGKSELERIQTDINHLRETHPDNATMDILSAKEKAKNRLYSAITQQEANIKKENQEIGTQLGIDISRPSLMNDDGFFSQKLGIILGVINVIGTIVAVVTIMLIGFKYMTGSIEDKAASKKSMVTWVVGAVIFFAVTTFVNIIYNLVKTMGLS